MTETQSFRRYRLLLITAWLVVLRWIASCAIRSKPSILRQPMFILTATAVIVGTLLPQQIKGVLDQQIPTSALYASTLGQKALNKPAIAQPEHQLALPVSPIFTKYKTGHVLMFALLSFVAFRIKPQKLPAWRLVIYLFVFALCTEALQFFIEGRESRWYDMAIDAIGITLGLMAWRLRKIMQKQQ